ncbi:MAG TPA: hypothetical protein VKB93_16085 [Thermoanaerobaculia bacterium]|nr:hypothetical protein [Thermoanaerobaculia bacterium]
MTSNFHVSLSPLTVPFFTGTVPMEEDMVPVNVLPELTTVSVLA